MEVFDRLAELGFKLPSMPVANGSYSLIKIHKGIAYLSGQLPRHGSGTDDLTKGRLKKIEDVEFAKEAAVLCFMRQLLVLHDHLGDLSKIEEFISIRGFLNAAPEFEFHARILDAVSNLALELFGSAGTHVRTALGAGSLPSGGVVELELMVSVSN